VTAKVPGVHAIVVTGMYRQDGRDYVRITDPWDRVVGTPGAPGPRPSTHNTGSRYIMTYEAFAEEFEAAGDIDRIQLLHNGGTHGHMINRGSAASAGYAQGLSDGKSVGTAISQDGFGLGTSLTRSTVDRSGVRYDLPALSGMVRPSNALAGGSGMPALPGQRVVLDDWPCITGPGGTSKAGVGIDWQFEGGAVGNITLSPLEPQLFDGWSASVRADICPGASSPNQIQLVVRIATTFAKAGEEDQVGITNVLLNGDGRPQIRHEDDGAVAPAEAADRTRSPATV
jgi:hypothetical protein